MILIYEDAVSGRLKCPKNGKTIMLPAKNCKSCKWFEMKKQNRWDKYRCNWRPE